MNILSHNRLYCCRNVGQFHTNLTCITRANKNNNNAHNPIIFSRRSLSVSQLKKYLDILDVSRTSTPKEIKDSFLKLSKVYHPDNKLTGSHAKFVELKEAYDAIKDGTPNVTTSSSQSYRYTSEDGPDLSHRAYRDFQNRYKQYQNAYQQGRPSSSFGGPYSHSSSPWEDLKRDRHYRQQREYARSFRNRKGSSLMNITIFVGALAWIVIYSSVLLIWDYNDNLRKGVGRFRSRSYEDYLAYHEYLKRKEIEHGLYLKELERLNSQTEDELTLDDNTTDTETIYSTNLEADNKPIDSEPMVDVNHHISDPTAGSPALVGT